MEDLPEEMQNMSLEERKAHVEAKVKERKEIQGKISSLNEERKKYVAEEMKKRGETEDNTFDAVMIRSIRLQAEKKGFQFEQP